MFATDDHRVGQTLQPLHALGPGADQDHPSRAHGVRDLHRERAKGAWTDDHHLLTWPQAAALNGIQGDADVVAEGALVPGQLGW